MTRVVSLAIIIAAVAVFVLSLFDNPARRYWAWKKLQPVKWWEAAALFALLNLICYGPLDRGYFIVTALTTALICGTEIYIRKNRK